MSADQASNNRTPLPLIGLLTGLLISGCVTTGSLGSTSTIDRLEVADKAFRDGDMEKAETEYERITADSPELVSPHFRLGLIAYRNGELTAATEHLQSVLRYDADHAPAVYNLAVISLEQSRRLLRRYERIDPSAAGTPALMRVRQSIGRLADRESLQE